MDPNAAVRDTLQALHDHDLDTARETWADLREWVAKGGFPPDGFTRDDLLPFQGE